MWLSGRRALTSFAGQAPPISTLNIFRDIRLTERFKIQIRAEAFNLTNTPHFANPGASVSNMSLNPDGSIKSLGGFSQITSTAPLGRLIDPRYFRFGLRFSF